MASEETLKEVLAALKVLSVNQQQLASSVDAISGRVNVLAGMKEVRDVASGKEILPTTSTTSGKNIDHSEEAHHDDVVPESPSLPATELDAPGSPSVKDLTQARKPSIATSRIILT